jgi:hypothetical protein
MKQITSNILPLSNAHQSIAWTNDSRRKVLLDITKKEVYKRKLLRRESGCPESVIYVARVP